MTQRIGNLVIIEPEEDRPCELCGKSEETRPYGPNGERVCYACGMKNPEAVQRAIDKLYEDPPAAMKTRPSLCPTCGKFLDAAMAISDTAKDGPAPGDLTVCMDCGTLLTYAEDLRLQLQDENELDAETRSEVDRLRTAIALAALMRVAEAEGQ